MVIVRGQVRGHYLDAIVSAGLLYRALVEVAIAYGCDSNPLELPFFEKGEKYWTALLGR